MVTVVMRNSAYRFLIVLIGSFLAVVLVTIGLAWILVGPGPEVEQAAPGPPSAPSSAPPPVTTSGIGGAVTVTGDRTDTLVFDREVIGDRYAVVGNDGRVEFDGQPASVAWIQFDGLDFFLDPDECAETPGERDAESGLVAVDVSCVAISDVREQGIVTIEGTLRVSGEQFGIRGDLPQTGGELAVGAETLTFEAATLDLQRPEFIYDPDTGRTTREPWWYPVTLDGENGTLSFEYDFAARELTLVSIELAGGLTGKPAATCEPSYSVLAELSPQVSVAEMTVDCPAVAFDGTGSMALTGTLIVDVITVAS